MTDVELYYVNALAAYNEYRQKFPYDSESNPGKKLIGALSEYGILASGVALTARGVLRRKLPVDGVALIVHGYQHANKRNQDRHNAKRVIVRAAWSYLDAAGFKPRNILVDALAVNTDFGPVFIMGTGDQDGKYHDAQFILDTDRPDDPRLNIREDHILDRYNNGSARVRVKFHPEWDYIKSTTAG